MKLKTHKATQKRIKISASGKILRAQSSKSHLLSHKRGRTKVMIGVATADLKKIKKLLPYHK